jgi:hypothetical protein
MPFLMWNAMFARAEPEREATLSNAIPAGAACADDFERHANEATEKWWGSLEQEQTANRQIRLAEKERLQQMHGALVQIPGWAQEVAANLPDDGFEICAHRWLDGLDDAMAAIGREEYRPSPAGRCGVDVPGWVHDGAERRVRALERWLAEAPDPNDTLGRRVAAWLGPRTGLKEEAACCFVEVVRAFFFCSSEVAESVAARWRQRAPANPVLQRLFYGEGLDRGLQHRCGFQSLYRLDLFVRVIGGDDLPLAETRWFCNTQLRHVLRDDSRRYYTTLGYVWGLYAYLAGHDERWVREHHPDVAGAALFALHSVSQAGPATPVRRWLVASLLSPTKYFCRRALTFAGRTNAPAYAEQMPDLLVLL